MNEDRLDRLMAEVEAARDEVTRATVELERIMHEQAVRDESRQKNLLAVEQAKRPVRSFLRDQPGLAVLLVILVMLVLLSVVTAVASAASAAPPQTTTSNEYGVTASSPCTTRLVVTSSPYALGYEVWSEGRLLATGHAGPGHPGVHTLALRKRQSVLVYSNDWGVVWLQLQASPRPCPRR